MVGRCGAKMVKIEVPLNKSEQLIYIATMSVKHSNHILYFRNIGANSQYLIEHKKIKKISANGEILYQE